MVPDVASVSYTHLDVYKRQHRDQVVDVLKGMIAPGDTVSHGGSETLKECGVRDFLTSGYCKYLDRSAPELSREQVLEVYRASFSADRCV